MTTKKKSRPLFEVPAEVESGAQSGWVYRSGADVESVPSVETSLDAADTSVRATSAAAVALTIAAFAQALMLGMTIAALPWTMGVRALRSFSKQSD
jgi:hypothetical protein